ncbi:hypothetical protein [Massilistercora timonensis]|uniref:hypothetical protein n=1 Tax=Massilistercora timonensis TaxID=2086584 RepID=UPI003AB4AE01
MSDREMAMQLLEAVPDYQIRYVIAFLQKIVTAGDGIPNEETIKAMREMENGGGECFDSLDELWKSLEDDIIED